VVEEGHNPPLTGAAPCAPGHLALGALSAAGGEQDDARPPWLRRLVRHEAWLLWGILSPLRGDKRARAASRTSWRA